MREPMTPPQLSLIARLAGKELREILRDRRTIVTLVLMPVLLYPLLSMAFRSYFIAAVAPEKAKAYRIAASSEQDAQRFRDLLGVGRPEGNSDDEPEFAFFESPDLEEPV